MFSKKKLTKFILLVLISQEKFKYNGYVLKKLVFEEFGFENENVFPVLRLLVEQQLVDVKTHKDEMNRIKKFYALNTNGWNKLDEYQNAIKTLENIYQQKGDKDE